MMNKLLFFSEEMQNVCGRFKADQLKGYTIPLAKINPSFALLKAGFLSLLLILAGRQVSAQQVQQRTKTEQTQQRKEESINSNELTHEKTISGVVVSKDDDTPMAGVNVILQGTTFGTATDINGHFIFPIKLKEGDVLLFSFIGSVTEEFKILKASPEQLDIKMKMDVLILGEISANEVYSVKPSRLQRLKFKIRSLF
ncbi:MAG: carboxypeptidase-like regulatory domain-containing protein [Cyclobacteriaceae bacterium]